MIPDSSLLPALYPIPADKENKLIALPIPGFLRVVRGGAPRVVLVIVAVVSSSSNCSSSSSSRIVVVLVVVVVE